MNNDELTQRVEEALASGELEHGMYRIVEELESSGATISSVEPVLKFMEAHPEEDFGSPGALVHFAERFQGYEDDLLRSIARRPATHTVWMLNRVINGTNDPAKREFLLATMRAVQDPTFCSVTRSHEVKTTCCDTSYLFAFYGDSTHIRLAKRLGGRAGLFVTVTPLNTFEFPSATRLAVLQRKRAGWPGVRWRGRRACRCARACSRGRAPGPSGAGRARRRWGCSACSPAWGTPPRPSRAIASRISLEATAR